MNESPFVVTVPYESRDYENINHPQLVIGGPGGEAGRKSKAKITQSAKRAKTV